MSCQEVDLPDYTVGDDITMGWEFHNGGPNGPLTNLTDHTFRSQIRYSYGDPTFYEWDITVTPLMGLVVGEMLEPITSQIPPGLLVWDMEETYNGRTITIMSGKVLFKPQVTQPVVVIP